MVITDRLSKGVWLEATEKIDADTVARLFVDRYYRYHGLPSSIVLDRGRTFVGELWTRVCKKC